MGNRLQNIVLVKVDCFCPGISATFKPKLCQMENYYFYNNFK